MKILKLSISYFILVAAAQFIVPFQAVAGGAGHQDDHGGHDDHEEDLGPNGGRLLQSGDFSLEITLFEGGLYPEYRIFSYEQGKIVEPENVSLSMQLHRLGGVIDKVRFVPENSYMKGDLEIYEPHSFEVHLEAKYKKVNHSWHYDSFEGRVTIPIEVANSMGIATALVGDAQLEEVVPAWGRIVSTAQGHQDISARFDGVVRKLHVDLGDNVTAGAALVDIESNESLKNYTVKSPISGVVDELYTSEGANTEGRLLMTVMDLSESVLELDVFQNNRARIKIGQRVRMTFQNRDEPLFGEIYYIASKMNPNQSFSVRVKFDEKPLNFPPGYFASAEIIVSTFPVERAVKKDALQAFRDFTVVYIKFEDTYEVRMLELGRESGEWVEVLGGIVAGAEYVVENSYILKADIEKAGASHDH